jgi:hypothetical protein
MKYIITENQFKFIRRYEQIKEKVSDFLMGHNIPSFYSFDDFLTELAWNVSGDIVNKMNIPQDEYPMFRNQMIRFIKNNFYEELKEYWERRKK